MGPVLQIQSPSLNPSSSLRTFDFYEVNFMLAYTSLDVIVNYDLYVTRTNITSNSESAPLVARRTTGHTTCSSSMTGQAIVFYHNTLQDLITWVMKVHRISLKRLFLFNCTFNLPLISNSFVSLCQTFITAVAFSALFMPYKLLH